MTECSFTQFYNNKIQQQNGTPYRTEFRRRPYENEQITLIINAKKYEFDKDCIKRNIHKKKIIFLDILMDTFEFCFKGVSSNL